MHNSALINLNVLEQTRISESKRFSTRQTACVYPEYNQMDPDNPKCSGRLVYPAEPDSEYGWESSSRGVCTLTYARTCNITAKVFASTTSSAPWVPGMVVAKSSAAICRKVAEAPEGGTIEIWGDGQTPLLPPRIRCVEGITA